MFFYFNALQNRLKYIKALKYLRLMLHTVFSFVFTQNCQFLPNRKASPTQHRTKPGLTTLCKTERNWSTDNTRGLYHTRSSCSAERIKH